MQYVVVGLPLGQEALIRHKNLKEWQILRRVGQGSWEEATGDYATEDAALAALEAEASG